ncbi:C99L2 protein, partial [Dyaphorophyia castanea]|nr:C99L2 protein [Platysteira castanea]
DTLSDLDLLDGNLPQGGSDDSGSNGKIEGCASYCFCGYLSSQGAIAGIVSAVAATVIGAVSSFIAYQKKKLCFKQSGKNS